MKKVGIFYGSTTGATEGVAETIAARLGVASEDIHNVGTTKVDEVDKYDVLLLGSSTWGIGELQDDWNDFLDKLKAKNLSGKTVAIFGCGDSALWRVFRDAIGIIYNELQGSGCQFAGSVDTDG
ncbi:MAG: flavodoxin domain-containing protein [Butyricimonas faecihominis]